MLLLVTLALVVASAALLILGFVRDALGFMYLSMLCAGVAALALFVFARLAKRRGAALAGAGVAAGGSSTYMPAAAGENEIGASSPREAADTQAMPEVLMPLEPEPVVTQDPDEVRWEEFARSGRYGEDAEEELPGPATVTSPQMAAEPWAEAGAFPAAEEDWGEEVVFPIENYDQLRVAEILPLLNGLGPGELQDVRDREVAGKARATILDRIDDRLGRDYEEPAASAMTASVPVVEPSAGGEPAGPGYPEAGVGAGRGGRAGRSAAGRTTDAAGAMKQVAARKTPAKKAAASGQTEAEPPPARKSPGRKVAAATEPGAPSSTARRAGAARKPEASGVDAVEAPAPGSGRGAAGAGAAQKASATAKRTSATAKEATGAAKKASGAAKKASGAAKRTSATAKEVTGVAQKASGVAKKASGAAKRSAENPERPLSPENP